MKRPGANPKPHYSPEFAMTSTNRNMRRARLSVELLEDRQVPATFPSPTEQLLLERLNDIRANPTAYGQSINLDLSSVAASQPLAFDALLMDAARGHSADMLARNYFAHTTPEGVTGETRVRNTGFAL